MKTYASKSNAARAAKGDAGLTPVELTEENIGDFTTDRSLIGRWTLASAETEELLDNVGAAAERVTAAPTNFGAPYGEEKDEFVLPESGTHEVEVLTKIPEAAPNGIAWEAHFEDEFGSNGDPELHEDPAVPPDFGRHLFEPGDDRHSVIYCQQCGEIEANPFHFTGHATEADADAEADSTLPEDAKYRTFQNVDGRWFWEEVTETIPNTLHANRGQSTIESPVARVWQIADSMPGARRKDVIAACEEAGIAFYTARTQYQLWYTKQKELEAERVLLEGSFEEGQQEIDGIIFYETYEDAEASLPDEGTWAIVDGEHGWEIVGHSHE